MQGRPGWVPLEARHAHSPESSATADGPCPTGSVSVPPRVAVLRAGRIAQTVNDGTREGLIVAGDIGNSLKTLFSGKAFAGLPLDTDFDAGGVPFYHDPNLYNVQSNPLFSDKQRDLMNAGTPAMISALRSLTQGSPPPQLLPSVRPAPRQGSLIPNTADPQLQALLKRLMQR